VISANNLDNTPTIKQIFDRSFLPSRDARPSKL